MPINPTSGRWDTVAAAGLTIEDTACVDAPDWLKEKLAPRMVLRGGMTVTREHLPLTIGPIGSRQDYVTVTFWPEVILSTGCFCFGLAQFKEEVARKTPGTVRSEYEALISFLEALAPFRGFVDGAHEAGTGAPECGMSEADLALSRVGG